MAIKFSYKKSGVVFSELWGINSISELSSASSDIVIIRDSHINVNNKLTQVKNGIISLNCIEKSYMENFEKKFSYESRKAISEGIQCHFFESQDLEVDDFYTDYHNFCISKKAPLINKHAINCYKKNNSLYLTVAKLEGDIIQYHLYLAYDTTVTLIASFPKSTCKLASKFFGWANRLLHKESIVFFANQNFRAYSLGGLGNPPSPSTLGIVSFKMEMNPLPQFHYDGIFSTTLKGKLYLTLSKIKEKIK